LRILVVHAHPLAASFLSAVHARLVAVLRAGGHEVDDLDLYAEAFDPVLSPDQMRSYVDTEKNTRGVENYVARLRAADALVLVFPVWFDGLPAILQGYFQRVFVPGATCFGPVRGLFGGAASRLVVPGSRVFGLAESLGQGAVLMALAATAYHAVSGGGQRDPIVAPDLIVGHGVLGRLLARLTVIGGYPVPTVWELDANRAQGAMGYPVLRPEDDPRRDYRAIYDVSGDSRILDALMQRLARGGEIVLAGFYSAPLGFSFPPAFMREARLSVAAQWQPADLRNVHRLCESGELSLDGLLTHRAGAADAVAAYRQAFTDPDCLKMVLDWSSRS